MKKIIKENKVFILSSLILSLLLTVSVEFVKNKHFSVLDVNLWINFILFFIMFILVFLLIKLIDNKIVKKINNQCEYTKDELIKYFLGNIIVLFCILWFVYLALYPGYYSYDAPRQLIQFFSDNQLSAHHPVIHTLLLSACVFIGNKFFYGTNCGIAIYTYIQMIIVIISLSYMFVKLLKFKVNKYIVIFSEALIVLNPVFQIFVMTTTKDVIFSALFIIWIIHIIERYEDEEKFFSSFGKICFYIINVIFMCLFRKQGIYIVGCVGIIQCFISKRYLKKNICLLVGIVSIFYFIIGPVSSWCGIIKSPIKEMLSVPLQQIARVINENGNITDEEKEIFYNIVSEENVNKYIPYISDPVKDNMNELYFKSHLKDFIKLYINIGVKNFSIYIDSFLYGIVGYVSPIEDVDNGYIGIFGFMSSYMFEIFDLPYIKEARVYSDTKFASYKYYLYDVRENMLADVPIISFWCNTSFSFWMFAISTVFIIYKKNYKYLIVSLIACVFLGILALGPVCCIRYVLPILSAVPIIISLSTKDSIKESVAKKS